MKHTILMIHDGQWPVPPSIIVQEYWHYWYYVMGMVANIFRTKSRKSTLDISR